MSKDMSRYRKVNDIKKHIIKDKKIIKKKRSIQLKECPRIKHSEDMPLKKPTKRCCFRVKHKKICMAHACLFKYLNENKIDYDFWSKFKCVI